MSKQTYEPQTYWRERLSAHPDLLGVGHRRFSLAYNAAMYEVGLENLDAALAQAGIDLAGRSVLDIGPGLGHFYRRFVELGARDLLGVDITEASVQGLQREFPGQRFLCADVSDLAPEDLGQFDLVSVISVIFHIVDEARFERTIRTLCRCVAPGGSLLVVDSFFPGPRPPVAHTRLRTLGRYRPLLAEAGLQIRRIHPMYYLLGHPWLGRPLAPLLDRPSMLPRVVRLERWMRRHLPAAWSGVQYMLAQAPQGKAGAKP